MKRSPLVRPNKAPKMTFATNGPNRDGHVEGEAWFSGEGTHVWRNGGWREATELRAEQKKDS